MRISLPSPVLDGKVSVERAIAQRRSRRSFTPPSLTQQEVSQLLWSAQGVTSKRNELRASPSAGATFPIEIYGVIRKVEGVSPGVYYYTHRDHSLLLHREGDLKDELAGAALGQEFIKEAPFSIVIAADYMRTTRIYGQDRGRRYVLIEVGHVGENLYLQAEALNLGTVAIGAFIDVEVKRVLNLPENLAPLYIMPFGHIKE